MNFKTEQEITSWIHTMHLQNTNGRETPDEMFKLGIEAAVEELIELGLIDAPSDLYERAIKKFGEESQMLMAIEECSELIQALSKVWRGKHSKSNIEEEIADVEIMIEQLKIIFDAGGVSDWRRIKLARIEELLQNDNNTSLNENK
jgi:hypothetical protein